MMPEDIFLGPSGLALEFEFEMNLGVINIGLARLDDPYQEKNEEHARIRIRAFQPQHPNQSLGPWRSRG